MEKTFTYQGFTFQTEEELTEARKEAEVVVYLKKQADLTNVETAVKLYTKLIEKKTMLTALGISFLKELRETALTSGRVAQSSLLPLPEPAHFQLEKKKKPESREKKLMELYKERCRNLSIAVVILCVTILIMFTIRMFGKNSPFVDYEQKVLNEYAGWKEELTAKEEELRLKAEELEIREKELERNEAIR